MDTNVIYLSDASHNDKTKEVGIWIKNLYTGLSLSIFTHAKSVVEAEEFALLEAINHDKIIDFIGIKKTLLDISNAIQAKLNTFEK